jgi:HK97 family phage prohead protease
MSTQSEERTFTLEVRDAKALEEERILSALLLPYGETTYDAGVPGGERFLSGAFRKTIKDRMGAKRPLLLFRAHDHSRPVGVAERLHDTPEGPMGEFRIARTAAGEEALQEVREGMLPEVSVGFRSIQERQGADGAREIREAALMEVSLVPMGAYSGAKVLSLRDQKPDTSWMALPPMPKVNPDAPLWTPPGLL